MDIYSIEELFPDYLRFLWKEVEKHKKKLQEIRIRANQPIMLYIDREEFFLDCKGNLQKNRDSSFKGSIEDIRSILNHLCQYSLYAYEEELRQGYFTIQGGHRVGIAGQVIQEQNRVKNIKYISSINIRIAHEIKGAANAVLPYIYHQNEIYNTMIISNPGCGKTTLLRDLIRQISDGNQFGYGRNVGVVDERSEIGGSYMGVPQNDVGMRTDILDACPKVVGMMMLIRSMAPRVVAIDEIGSADDLQALHSVLQCGCRLIVTVHGDSLNEIKDKELFRPIMKNSMFERFIILGNQKKACMVQEICDANGKVI